jgi:hypothetical protein
MTPSSAVSYLTWEAEIRIVVLGLPKQKVRSYLNQQAKHGNTPVIPATVRHRLEDGGSVRGWLKAKTQDPN